MLTLEDIYSRCTEEGECLIWDGSTSTDGYPLHNGVRIRRLAWELARQQTLPAGLYIVDTCDRRLCCNDKHLKAYSRKAQMALASRRGKLFNPLRAVKIAAAKRQSSQAKLDDGKAREVFDRYHARTQSGETLTSIAADYGVHHSVVDRIGKGKAWAQQIGCARGASVFNMG